ncbi:30S ribosomal protein S4e [Candidatus Micrarchaeota archaeon]|nr:30S ribosomal protein S4e [Candidatus Micrarchaeota archaeon]
MARHGNYRHLKRLAKSKAIKIPKKGMVWLAKSEPGKHEKNHCMPLVVLLRDVMKLTKNASETKTVLNAGHVLVDGVVQRKTDVGIGLMDIVSFPKLKKHYQIFMVRGALAPVEISDNEAKFKSCRVVNKTLISGNKVQLNLHDGRNVIIEKEEDRFRVGDTVRVTIPDNKIDLFIKLEKGVKCYIFKGKHSGTIGVLEEIVAMPGGLPSQAHLSLDGKQLITQKNYLFAVAKDFPGVETK